MSSLLSRFTESMEHYVNLLKSKNPFVVISSFLFGYITVRYAFISIYRKSRKYPAGPVGIPFIGTALMFLRSPYQTLNKIGSYGKLTTVQMGLNTNIFINDITLAKKIMSNKAVGFSRSPIANLPRFVHFLAMNGKPWQKRRKYFTSKLVPAISDSKYIFTNIDNTINADITEDMDNIIKNNELWYPNRHCSFIDLNLMINGMFGINISLNNDTTGFVSKLLPVPQMWFISITRVLILAACINFNIGSFLYKWFTNDHNKLEKDAGNMLMEFMKTYGDFEFDFKQNKLSRKVDRSSYIDFLINETDMNLDEIMSDVALALIAGTNTTSKAMEYGFILLSRNPEIQERIYEELQTIDDICNGINKANVLRAFIQEVLRLSVVSPLGMPHYATKDVMIEGKYFIPKGAIVHNNMYYMHRNGDVDDDIHLEYWLNEDGKFKMDNSRFMLFSYGGRGCPGRPIAMKLMYYVLSLLIMKYKFISVNDDKIKQTFGTVPVIDPQIGIKLEKRV